MDPWGEKTCREEVTSCCTNSFQNSFLEENGGKFEKLPDSQEYLSQLESKLKQLTKKKGEKSFRQNKEEILGNLIRSESKQILGILSDSDLALDREIQPNLVLRQLQPQQPLTVGETVHLVESDQLDQSYAAGSEDPPRPMSE